MPILNRSKDRIELKKKSRFSKKRLNSKNLLQRGRKDHGNRERGIIAIRKTFRT